MSSGDGNTPVMEGGHEGGREGGREGGAHPCAHLPVFLWRVRSQDNLYVHRMHEVSAGGSK